MSHPISKNPKPLGVFAKQNLHEQICANLDTMNAQGTYGARDSWSVTLSYLAHLIPGVHLGFGLNYTTHPSGASFFGPSKANPFQRFQGDSLNFQINLFTLI